MDTPKILVVGSINMDICMYEVEGLPQIGMSSFCTGYKFVEGGKGSNQALAVSKLGAKSTMAGRIGTKDANGVKLVASLENAGVNTDYIVRDSEHLTGMSIMSILPDGKYYSIYAKGANDYITPEDVKNALDGGHFDMVLMQLEMPSETVYRCFEMAKERKIPVFLDAGPAMKIDFKRLKGLNIISPNEAEAETLTGISVKTDEGTVEAARKLYREIEPEYVLLKLGERGAMLYDGSSVIRIPAFSVNAVDTTAAGDTFSAWFVIQYCKGKPAKEAVLLANAAAAISVTRKGGHPSIPSEKEVEEFCREHVVLNE